MTSYMIRRILSMIPTLFLVTVVSFFLIHLIPGDPAAVMLGPYATEDQVEQLSHAMGFDKPIIIQFRKYVSRLVRGDLGQSILFHIPVEELILQRAETSIMLAIFATIVSFLIGITSGIVSAVKRNTWIDQSLLTVSLLGVSIPSFWLGLMMMSVFAAKLHWLPSSGFPSICKTGNLANLRYLVLPALTLGFGNSALLARLTRSSMLDVFQEDYITTARSKGVPEVRLILKHALRNASIPVVTVLSFTFAGLLSRAVVIESVFALPGVGRLVVESVLARDYPTIQGIMIVVAFTYLFVNFLTDVAYSVLDPRIRYH